MRHVSEEQLKVITIKKVMVLLNEDTTDEITVPSFRVYVDDTAHNDHTEEEFGTLEEAEAYAADVATRPLRSYEETWDKDLFKTR